MNHPAQPAPEGALTGPCKTPRVTALVRELCRLKSNTLRYPCETALRQLAEELEMEHAAAQAETVALINECSGTIKLLYRDKNSVIVVTCNDLLDRLAARLTQLKEGAP